MPLVGLLGLLSLFWRQASTLPPGIKKAPQSQRGGLGGILEPCLEAA